MLVKFRRYLKSKIFQIKTRKVNSLLGKIFIYICPKNLEEVFISNFVEENFIIEKDDDISKFTISNDLLTQN